MGSGCTRNTNATKIEETVLTLPQYKSNLADAMLQIQKFGNASPLIRLDNAIDIVKCGVI